MRRSLALLVALSLLHAAPARAAYTGAAGVWATPKGEFVATPFDGSNTGIQAAWNFVGPGGEIKLSAGRFPISATILAAMNGITMVGAGDSTVLYNAAASGDTLIVLYGSNNTIRNLRLEGDRASKTAGVGIAVKGSGNKIENLTIVGTPEEGALVTGRGNRITGTRFLDTAKRGVFLDSGADSSQVDDNVFSGTVGSPGYGLQTNGISNTSIMNNSFSNTRETALWLSGLKHSTVEGNRISKTFNTAEIYVGGGIALDSLCQTVNVVGNNVDKARGAGIEADGDSCTISGNIITGASNAIHVHHGTRANVITGNFMANSSGYGLYIELYGQGGTPADSGKGDWDLIVTGNMVIDPGYNCVHLEANTTPHGRVVVEGNFLYGGKTANLSSIRVLAVGGSWRGLSIRNNHIYKPKGSGIEAIHTSGTGNISDLVIEGNEIYDAGRYGIEMETWPTGTSSAYISGNYVVRPASGEMSLGGNWNYSNTGKITARATTQVVEDSLRVDGPARFGLYDFASLPASPPNGTIIYCTDCQKTTPTSGGGTGAFAYRVNGAWDSMAPGAGGSGDSTGLAYLPGRAAGQVLHGSNASTTGGSTYLGLRGFNGSGSALIRMNQGVDITPGGSSNVDIYRNDGTTLNLRIPGAGGMNLTNNGKFQLNGFNVLYDSSPDRRIVERSTAGGIAIRDSADTVNRQYFTADGSGWFSNSLTAADSITALGALYAASKATVLDSLRVIGRINVGQKSGIPNVQTFASSPSASAADSLTFILDGTTNTAVLSPVLRFRRAGADVGAFGASNSGWGVRTDTTRFFGFASLGAPPGLYNSTVYGGGSRWNIGAGTDPGAGTVLKITGNALTAGKHVVQDSMRVTGTTELVGNVQADQDLSVGGKLTVADSIRVSGAFSIGQKTGIPTVFKVQSVSTSAADSVIMILDGTTSGSVWNPTIRFRRAGAEKGAIGAATTSWGVKTDSSYFFGYGWLGSSAAQWASQIWGGGKNWNLNGSGNCNPYVLKVNGQAWATDSLRSDGTIRADQGLYVGGQKVNKFLRASASLDFDLTTLAYQDLTISVPGASVGDEVVLGAPALTADVIYPTPVVTSANTVTVRAVRIFGTSPDPAPGTFKVTVIH